MSLVSSTVSEFSFVVSSSLSLSVMLFSEKERKSEGHDTYFYRLVYSRSQDEMRKSHVNHARTD